MAGSKTVIVTGASQGIGAAVTRAFLDRGYNVVANFPEIFRDKFCGLGEACVGGGRHERGSDGGENYADCDRQVRLHRSVVNNAGIFFGKSFTEYTIEDFRKFVAVNLEGFFFMTQRAVRQMLAQGNGGSVTTITAALADNPMVVAPASVAMITKGGLNTATRSLANEYAKQHIRFNAVAPGVVNTPLHNGAEEALLKDRNPMGTISEAKDIAEAVVYLAEAAHVTGEVLYVDDGAHVGRW